MKFQCIKESYDNARCVGYRLGEEYDLSPGEISKLRGVGLFPKIFNPLDGEARSEMKKGEPREEVKEPDDEEESGLGGGTTNRVEKKRK